MKNLLLLITSIVLTTIVGVISIVFTPVYYLITFEWRSGLKQLDQWFWRLALSIDQTGNVLCGSTLKVMMTREYGHPFGDEDDTVSYVLGRNKCKDALTILGRGVVRILGWIEKDHVDIAIYKKIEKDQQARNRLNEMKYWQ